MWTIAVSGKKKLRIQKYPDTCGRGLSETCTQGNSLPQVSVAYQDRMFISTCIHAHGSCDSPMEISCFATPSLACIGDEDGLFLQRDCRRDISSYLKTYGLSKWSEDISDEVDLLLCRG